MFYPEQRKAWDEPFPLAPPVLTLPDDSGTGYLLQQAGQPLMRGDGRPVAQLVSLPRPLNVVSANLPTGPIDDSVIGFTVHGSVRYTGGGQVVYVNTAKPTAAALQREMMLGSRTVTLTDGTTAWTTEKLPEAASNMVVIIRDGLIISLTGSLPLDELKILMTQVVIR